MRATFRIAWASHAGGQLCRLGARRPISRARDGPLSVDDVAAVLSSPRKRALRCRVWEATYARVPDCPLLVKLWVAWTAPYSSETMTGPSDCVPENYNAKIEFGPERPRYVDFLTVRSLAASRTGSHAWGQAGRRFARDDQRSLTSGGSNPTRRYPFPRGAPDIPSGADAG